MTPRIAILHGLQALANDRAPVALLWHAALLVSLTAFAAARRCPSRAVTGILLCSPLLSAALLAWLSNNYFNGGVLSVLSAALLFIASRLPSDTPVRRARGWEWYVGWATLLFAVTYPHFVRVHDVAHYLLWAPLGVLPCPTLALLVGASLLCSGLGSAAWTNTSAAAALAYGAFGVLVLGVWLDAALVFAALALIIAARANQQDHLALSQERVEIDAFLALRHIALVGASRNDTDFSRVVMENLQANHVDVIPIHPTAALISEQLAYSTIAELRPPVQGALIMTPSAASAAVVEDCARAGVSRLWFHRGVGAGSASPEALDAAARHGMSVVANRCIMMFLRPSRVSIHRAHGVALRMLGHFPERAGGCARDQAGSTDP